MGSVDLTQFSRRGYHPGAGLVRRALWIFAEPLTIRSPFVLSYGLKRTILRAFGAEIGAGVVLKPGIQIKNPWRLKVGDHAWIGENAWIDNMEDVSIGAHAVLSQGTYLCTGNHDWSDPGMGLTPSPIVVEEGAWVAAFSRVGPGITIGRNAVVTLGAVVLRDCEADGVYSGNPATKTSRRRLTDREQAE